jgi:alpha-beta hydrolase superfamily lysophospholipase
LFEHGGRYRALAGHLAEQGYAVYAPDLRGHGMSQGKRVWARSFSDYISDLERFMQHASSDLAAGRVFMLGHCMGSLVAANYAVEHQSGLSGLITSGAFLKPGASFSPVTAAGAYLFGALPLLSSSVGVPLFNERGISRSQRVAKSYLEDSLVFHGNVSARLGLLILRQMRSLPRKLDNLHLPLLAMHGTAALISNAEGSRLLWDKAASPDKT